MESFPCREDYAELLTEMLAKRVKYGESLEHYYYAKLNLLNRCKIYGKQAVDCVLYGLDDRAIKVGAQAAQFSEPEQILKYFRTVKVGHNREVYETNSRNRNDRKSFSNAMPRTQRQNLKSNIVNSNIRCFNCKVGHPSFRCDKPYNKCLLCDRLGHQAADCHRNKFKKDSPINETQSKDKTEKQVSELTINGLNNKYIVDIKINGKVVKCHINLGSQCTLIRMSHANNLSMDIWCPRNLPVLRGIGSNLTKS